MNEPDLFDCICGARVPTDVALSVARVAEGEQGMEKGVKWFPWECTKRGRWLVADLLEASKYSVRLRRLTRDLAPFRRKCGMRVLPEAAASVAMIGHRERERRKWRGWIRSNRNK